MVYDTTDAFPVTKKQLMQYTTEYDIFAQYMGFKPVIGNLYTSPLRRDTNPSFGLFYAKNGHLLFKDFGTGDTGNCFKFVCLMDGVRSSEVYKYLYKQFSKNIIKPHKTVEPPKRKTNQIDIVVERMNFTPEALHYWNSFGISETTLNLYNVSQISKYWSNGRLYGFHTSKNPIFNYNVFDKNKLYRPYHKVQRFYTNCTMYDVQGWEQLDFTRDTVIITKSLKDVMLFHELGYSAIAPNGEGHSLPKKALKILRENFKYIIVWYDKDPSGMKSARKLLKQNQDFGFAFTKSRKQKDVSDYFKENGKQKTEALISKKISNARQNHFKNR